MTIKAVIFDLDGVLISTDQYHYEAWKILADNEGIPFDRSRNERLRGVSRMESLNIILEQSTAAYSEQDKEQMASSKNTTYRGMLEELSPDDVLAGVRDFLDFLDAQQIRTAIGSSSRNAKLILEKTGLAPRFEGRVTDGTDIEFSKPHPQVYELAAERLGMAPEHCLVVEDADAGVLAAKAAGMRVLGLGTAKDHPLCDFRAEDVSSIERTIFINNTR